MKNFIILGSLVYSLLAIGCARIVPVSSETAVTQKTDSIATRTEERKDSSFYRETLEEKTLPRATVGITLTPSQLDSLYRALGSLPSSMQKTVYYHDPKLRAMLSIALDSLGRYRFDCAANEQKYYEKTTEMQRYLSQLVNENKELKKINNTLIKEVKKVEPSWFKQFWQSLGNFGWFLVVFLGGVLMIGIISKFNILNFFRK